MANFLTEAMTFDQAQVLLEGGGLNDQGKPKDLYMRGIFVQGGVKNHNQRVYPVNEIRNAVDQLNETLRRGESILGEADHPEELNINLDRVSHMITEMYMDGPNGIGKLKVLPTPMGNIVRTLLESGVKLGVSSRGSGNVTASGDVSDFEIVTVDVVARPSAPAAYPKAVYEAYNMRRGAITQDLAEAMTHDAKAQKYLQDELLNFINSLK
ncbi:Prohead core protein protease [compost metagenome]